MVFYQHVSAVGVVSKLIGREDTGRLPAVTAFGT